METTETGGATRERCPWKRHSGRPARHKADFFLALLCQKQRQMAQKRAQTGIGGCVAGWCGAPTACHSRPIGHEVWRIPTEALFLARSTPFWPRFGGLPPLLGATAARSGEAARSRNPGFGEATARQGKPQSFRPAPVPQPIFFCDMLDCCLLLLLLWLSVFLVTCCVFFMEKGVW